MIIFVGMVFFVEIVNVQSNKCYRGPELPLAESERESTKKQDRSNTTLAQDVRAGRVLKKLEVAFRKDKLNMVCKGLLS